jgi:uncharacterized protein (DUF885 family)
MWIRAALVVSTVFAAACQPIGPLQPKPPSDVGLWPDAAGRTASEPLGEICDAHWNGYLAANPEFASTIGDPRFHGEVTNRSIDGREARRDELWRLEQRINQLPADRMTREDMLTRDLLLHAVRAETLAIEKGIAEWSSGTVIDLLVEIATLPSIQPTASRRERDQMVTRWKALASTMRRVREGLIRGSTQDRIAPRASLVRVLAICDRLLETPVMEHPLVAPATGGGRWVELSPTLPLATLAERELGSADAQLDLRRINRHLASGDVRALGTKVLIPSPSDPLTPDERGRFLEATVDTVGGEVLPALAQLRATIADRLLPRARADQRAGLMHLPGGRDAYFALLAVDLGDGVATEEDFDDAAAAADELRAAALAAGSTVLGAETLAGLRDALANDPRAALDGPTAVIAALESQARETRALVPRVFGVVPGTQLAVEPLPAALAFGVDAFAYTGSTERALAHLHVDTVRLAERSVFEVRALALREMMPGRHLWESIARENTALPRFRRHLFTEASASAFGLYTLAVGEELGLLSGPEDLLGAHLVRLEAAALAAMDFAVHADGWGRTQAIEYLRKHVPHSEADIAAEVDLLYARPGHAFATWILAGEMERLLRAERDLTGDAFSPLRFHERLTRTGPVPASLLGRALDR